MTSNDGLMVFKAPNPATPEFLENASRQASGLLPAGADAAPDVPVSAEAGLPFAAVAWTVVSREIGQLKSVLEGMERELARGAWGVGGSPVPHLLEQHERIREEIPKIKAEIARLENLTDQEARRFAADKGYS